MRSWKSYERAILHEGRGGLTLLFYMRGTFDCYAIQETNGRIYISHSLGHMEDARSINLENTEVKQEIRVWRKAIQRVWGKGES